MSAGGNVNIAASVIAGTTGDSVTARNVNLNVVSNGTGLQVGGGIPSTQPGTAQMSDGFLRAIGSHGNVSGNVVITSNVNTTLNGGADNHGETPLGNLRVVTPKDVALSHNLDSGSLTITSGGNITGTGSYRSSGDVVLASTGR